MTPELLKAIEDTFDKKINGKLLGLKDHLNKQDKVLEEVRDLLEQRKFLLDLWKVMKFLGGVVVSIGGALLLYKNLK